MSPSLPTYHRIVDRDGLETLAERLAAAPWVALDTESNSYFVYRERVCLMQLSAGGELFLVDPLELPLEPATLDPLRAALEDPDKPVYLHGGEYDVAVLKRDYQLSLRGVFDSQQAASSLGFHKTGYGSLVEALLDVKLPKQHAQHDWAARPIPDDALAYALDDVVYLPRLVDLMRGFVAEADLVEEVAIANRAVEGASAHDPSFDPAAFWRIKGARDLCAAERRVLFALYRWRDAAAREADRPPGRLVSTHALLQLARAQPRTADALRGVKGKGRVIREHGDELVAVISAALEDPPTLPPRPDMAAPAPGVRAAEARLKRWRRSEADRRGVPQHVVLPPRALAHLAREGAGDLDAVPQLGDKRVRLYGDVLRELLGPQPQHR